MVETSEQFIHRRNIANFTKQLAETTDDAKRKLLQTLLAEEMAKNDLKSDPKNKLGWSD